MGSDAGLQSCLLTSFWPDFQFGFESAHCRHSRHCSVANGPMFCCRFGGFSGERCPKQRCAEPMCRSAMPKVTGLLSPQPLHQLQTLRFNRRCITALLPARHGTTPSPRWQAATELWPWVLALRPCLNIRPVTAAGNVYSSRPSVSANVPTCLDKHLDGSG